MREASFPQFARVVERSVSCQSSSCIQKQTLTLTLRPLGLGSSQQTLVRPASSTLVARFVFTPRSRIISLQDTRTKEQLTDQDSRA